MRDKPLAPLVALFAVVTLTALACVLQRDESTELVSFTPLPNLDGLPSDTALYDSYYLFQPHTESAKPLLKAVATKSHIAKSEKHPASVSKIESHAPKKSKFPQKQHPVAAAKSEKALQHAAVKKYLQPSALKKKVSAIIAERKRRLQAQARRASRRVVNEEKKKALRVKEVEKKAAQAKQLKKTVKDMADAELSKEFAAFGLSPDETPAKNKNKSPGESLISDLGFGVDSATQNPTPIVKPSPAAPKQAGSAPKIHAKQAVAPMKKVSGGAAGDLGLKAVEPSAGKITLKAPKDTDQLADTQKIEYVEPSGTVVDYVVDKSDTPMSARSPPESKILADNGESVLETVSRVLGRSSAANSGDHILDDSTLSDAEKNLEKMEADLGATPDHESANLPPIVFPKAASGVGAAAKPLPVTEKVAVASGDKTTEKSDKVRALREIHSKKTATKTGEVKPLQKVVEQEASPVPSNAVLKELSHVSEQLSHIESEMAKSSIKTSVKASLPIPKPAVAAPPTRDSAHKKLMTSIYSQLEVLKKDIIQNLKSGGASVSADDSTAVPSPPAHAAAPPIPTDSSRSVKKSSAKMSIVKNPMKKSVAMSLPQIPPQTAAKKMNKNAIHLTPQQKGIAKAFLDAKSVLAYQLPPAPEYSDPTPKNELIHLSFPDFNKKSAHKLKAHKAAKKSPPAAKKSKKSDSIFDWF